MSRLQQLLQWSSRNRFNCPIVHSSLRARPLHGSPLLGSLVQTSLGRGSRDKSIIFARSSLYPPPASLTRSLIKSQSSVVTKINVVSDSATHNQIPAKFNNANVLLNGSHMVAEWRSRNVYLLI